MAWRSSSRTRARSMAASWAARSLASRSISICRCFCRSLSRSASSRRDSSYSASCCARRRRSCSCCACLRLISSRCCSMCSRHCVRLATTLSRFISPSIMAICLSSSSEAGSTMLMCGYLLHRSSRATRSPSRCRSSSPHTKKCSSSIDRTNSSPSTSRQNEAVGAASSLCRYTTSSLSCRLASATAAPKLPGRNRGPLPYFLRNIWGKDVLGGPKMNSDTKLSTDPPTLTTVSNARCTRENSQLDTELRVDTASSSWRAPGGGALTDEAGGRSDAVRSGCSRGPVEDTDDATGPLGLAPLLLLVLLWLWLWLLLC
mmetsp:Transcript_7553/g.18436  ORF Transcript_7553/g.18436 Transcript_7553/m.18436 type:complete len:316 (+) Transcript_7553:533-1480(+)